LKGGRGKSGGGICQTKRKKHSGRVTFEGKGKTASRVVGGEFLGKQGRVKGGEGGARGKVTSQLDLNKMRKNVF